MNENELRTMEDENTNMDLYTTQEVEVEEDDGPGFGLGVGLGVLIGGALTVGGKKLYGYIKKKRQDRVVPPTNASGQVIDAEVIEDPAQEPTVLDMTKGKKKG